MKNRKGPKKESVVLKMDRISKSFPGVKALDNVDFTLLQGSVHILLGENGAGKSTLVKILSGAHQKTSGKIFIKGKEVNIRNPHHAQQLGIGIIYQELNLIPQLTVAENIFLGRERQKYKFLLDEDWMNQEAQAILDRLGVQIQAGDRVNDLGIAQQQMVEVAKALAVDVRVLIMDEPTSALTDTEITQLFTLIRHLRERGVSIIYISHRMEELFGIGDMVTVLRDGKCIATKSIADTCREELIRMMVNRELDEQYHREKPDLGNVVLEVESLNGVDMVRNINFSVRAGELVGIAGLLGSGRTELARIIFGADPHVTGQIYIHGKKMHFKNPRDAIMAGVGLLTEDRKSQGLIMTMSVKDNITLPSLGEFIKHGVVRTVRERAAAESYAKQLNVKMSGIDQSVLNLSGGNQQKVVLSKWLCRKADLLIFDEPTRGIDVKSKHEFYDLMNALTAQGTAIIVISSDLPEIIGISDRVLVMHKGTLSGSFDRSEMTAERILNSALGGAGEA